MLYTYLIVLFYALFRAIRGVVRTKNSLLWLAKNSKQLGSKSTYKNRFKIYFLIPVLREQEIISKTFSTFTNLLGSYNVIFITTNKEINDRNGQLKLLRKLKKDILQAKTSEEFASVTNGIFPRSTALKLFGQKWSEIIKGFKNLKTTRSMLNTIISNSSKAIRDKVSVLNYPKSNGNMSDQLNYALRKIVKTENPENTYVCMYNADSIVSKYFPIKIMNYINKNQKNVVIQQSALFLSNFHELGSSLSGSFLKAIALLQSRWTLAHEMPRISSQLKSFVECAHIVGHGLIIKLSIIKKVGYFPTNYINEDLPFGYILKLNGYNIFPFPQLECAQSPTSIKSMFTQYTTWFYGVFHYPKYMLNAFREYPQKRIQAFIWGIKYTVRSLLWLGLSIAWLFLFLYPIFSSKFYLLLFSFTVFLIYSPLCTHLMGGFLNKNGQKIFGKGVFEKINLDIKTYFMSIPVYLTHSYGPLIASMETIKSLVFGVEIKKKKTER